MSNGRCLAAHISVETDVGSLWLSADDLVTRHLQAHGSWEPPVGNLLRSRLRPGSRFLDIGSFIGYFTILASKLVGPDGHVVAVDPDPTSVALLRLNLERNRCVNVTVLPLAAWNAHGERWLSTNPLNRAGSTVHADRFPGDVVVPAAPLDSLLDESFDLIKVDAEGSDHLALQGAARLLRRCPLAIVEFWPNTMVSGATPREVLDCYQDLSRGFGLLRDNGTVEPTSAEDLLGLGTGYVELALTRERAV